MWLAYYSIVRNSIRWAMNTIEVYMFVAGSTNSVPPGSSVFPTLTIHRAGSPGISQRLGFSKGTAYENGSIATISPRGFSQERRHACIRVRQRGDSEQEYKNMCLVSEFYLNTQRQKADSASVNVRHAICVAGICIIRFQAARSRIHARASFINFASTRTPVLFYRDRRSSGNSRQKHADGRRFGRVASEIREANKKERTKCFTRNALTPWERFVCKTSDGSLDILFRKYVLGRRWTLR